MNILLVEDDALIADGLVSSLQREGFTVNALGDGKEALTQIRAEPPDILVLDLGLPGMDGMDVLKYVRRILPALPVLILTARDQLHNKVDGLDAGADDYLTKPFELSELIARLRAFERRLMRAGTNDLVVGAVTLDPVTHSTKIEGEPVSLTRREYMLLKALMQSTGSIMNREQLEAKLYSWGEQVTSNAIEVHVHHLRKKLPEGFIQTVHGMGYIIRRQ